MAELAVVKSAEQTQAPLIIDDAFEDKVMACMFRVNDFASVASVHLRPSYFGNPMRRNLAKLANDFWHKYNAIVRGPAFAHEIKDLLDKKIIQPDEAKDYGNYVMRLYNADISDHQWVLDKLVEFIKLTFRTPK